MKRSLIATALLGCTVFGTGYAFGQIGGPTGSSAATVATPSVVQTLPDAAGHPGPSQDTPHADGTVTAISGDTLTISAGTDPSGTTEYTKVTTVTLSAGTQYDAGHDSTATAGKSSIKVGSYIIVDGTLSSDGTTIAASRVDVHAGGPVPGR
ncbi:MAG: hypothetical protein NVS2B16_04480 [Chloroflexota bacterium]